MDRYSKVLDLLEQAWQLEQQFLNEQPPEERERPGSFEHWARKDVVAHIETWDGRLAENIRESLHGGSPHRNEDFDAENKKIFELHQGKTWQEAYAYAAEGRHNLVEVVKELGPEGLERLDILPWQEEQPIWNRIIGNGFTHTLIHIGEHYRDLGEKAHYARLIELLSTATVDLDDSPNWQGGVLYNLACAHALNGEIEKAIIKLHEALRLRPNLKDWSRQDADLASLHGKPEYEALYS